MGGRRWATAAEAPLNKPKHTRQGVGTLEAPSLDTFLPNRNLPDPEVSEPTAHHPRCRKYHTVACRRVLVQMAVVCRRRDAGGLVLTPVFIYLFIYFTGMGTAHALAPHLSVGRSRDLPGGADGVGQGYLSRTPHTQLTCRGGSANRKASEGL